MKLIVELTNNDDIFVYRETEHQFRKNERQRKHLNRITLEDLDNECDLNHYSSCYLVVDIKK